MKAKARKRRLRAGRESNIAENAPSASTDIAGKVARFVRRNTETK
ncbi:MAG: hypothetical protein ACYDH9_12705 [Limisphaerales bacterium]